MSLMETLVLSSMRNPNAVDKKSPSKFTNEGASVAINEDPSAAINEGSCNDTNEKSSAVSKGTPTATINHIPVL